MSELRIRAVSGFLYIALLIASLFSQHAFIILFYFFGFICLVEFNRLIQLKRRYPYVVFTILYLGFGYWQFFSGSNFIVKDLLQIIHVISIFVELLLIKDLFSYKTIPLFQSKRLIITTFYLSTAFVFLVSISTMDNQFSPWVILGAFVLVWTNDSFAYIVGKNFGRQKLFPRISPKKTVEGFLGGLFFSCIASLVIAEFTKTLPFNHWLFLGIIVSVFGTLGDLIESKFKRQANVKDSGVIMPGHGGLLDRLDSIIFASPFIYLFLKIMTDVS